VSLEYFFDSDIGFPNIIARGIHESMTLFLIGLDAIISPEQDETDSYTNVSFLDHGLWFTQENGDMGKCSCSRLHVAIHLVDCADLYLHFSSLPCRVQSLRQNTK